MSARAALAAAALALALPQAALAHERPGQRLTYDPPIFWLDAPNISRQGNGRVRLVSFDADTRAALTVNQYDLWQQAYRRSLARRAFHGPVNHHATARARQDAFRAVLAAYPELTVPGFATTPIQAGRD
ncbi:hypothetical protein [Jannaschia ovalis]|uniref:Uncharacterized protein n=1 Tax=Jannaschia ovalis TaxID=3038773 RepID=A0ABY8LCW7_9RHOB|nr:hypothetical protein [Jannaschia sp. GRR-S6-38]WGH77900.1 hypothetical protein P8627_12770 [Jannaschia sp. GRR-S6-38]